MSKQTQSFVFVAKTAPYGSSKPQLCLDAALATAVFEQSVSYVFTGDGVYQLLKDQNAEAIQAKTLGNAMETLDLYGIDQVYVDGDSLESRGLTGEDLVLQPQEVNATEISDIIHRSDHVFIL